VAFFLEAVAQLWLHGAPIQLEKQYENEPRRRVPLPTYCWQKERHFVEAPKKSSSLSLSFDSPIRTPRTPRLDHTLSPKSNEDQLMRLVTMKSIWIDTLGISTVSATANFFEIGGTSLQGMQLIARIRETFQVHFRLEEFYDKPTIENALVVIAQKKSNPTAPMTPAFNRTKRRGPIPTSYPQQRIWFMEQYYPGTLLF
jgi:acyl carrier protein